MSGKKTPSSTYDNSSGCALNCGTRAAAPRPRDERGDGLAQAGGQGNGRGGASGAGSPAGAARARHTGPAGRPGGLGGLLGVPQRCPGGAGQPGAAGLAGQRRLPDSRRCRLAPRPGAARPRRRLFARAGSSPAQVHGMSTTERIGAERYGSSRSRRASTTWTTINVRPSSR